MMNAASMLNTFSDCLKAAVTAAWQGRCRLFTPQDAPMLQEDLEAAKALFHADGDGLPADQIGYLCKVRLDVQDGPRPSEDGFQAGDGAALLATPQAYDELYAAPC